MRMHYGVVLGEKNHEQVKFQQVFYHDITVIILQQIGTFSFFYFRQTVQKFKIFRKRSNSYFSHQLFNSYPS